MKAALDKREYKKRVLLRLLTSPWSLIPGLGGTTLLIAGWALGLKAGAVLFGGVVGVLVGIGTFFTRLLAGNEKLEQQVLQEMREEAEEAREEELDELERALMEDCDPRTEQSLHELRVLATAFQRKESWASDVDSGSSFDIMSGVNQLFASCVKYLKMTLELWRTAQEMESEGVRKPILERREKLVEDVRKSTQHISDILARAQTLGVGEEADSALKNLREELDVSLDVAKRVQERIAGWGLPDYDLKEFETGPSA
jgi:hypothetical protein